MMDSAAKWMTFAWRGFRLSVHLFAGILLTLTLRWGGHTHPPVVRWWHRMLCQLLHIRVHLEGEFTDDSVLLVANHISWIDIPVLGSVVNASFLSKDEVRRWPLVGWLAAKAGTLFIRRGGHQTQAIRKTIDERLARGTPVVLFPEGTTTDGRSLAKFFPRLLAPAVDSNHRVQPVAIRYFDNQGNLDTAVPFIGDESFPNHLKRVLKHPVVNAEIIPCAPLEAPHTDRRQLADQARSSILSALSGMTPPAFHQTSGTESGNALPVSGS